MKKVKCFCCENASDVPYDGHLATFSNQSKYHPLMDIGNGIEIHWVCPECQTKMIPFIRGIVSMIPEKRLDYMHWPSFVQMIPEFNRMKK